MRIAIQAVLSVTGAIIIFFVATLLGVFFMKGGASAAHVQSVTPDEFGTFISWFFMSYILILAPLKYLIYRDGHGFTTKLIVYLAIPWAALFIFPVGLMLLTLFAVAALALFEIQRIRFPS